MPRKQTSANISIAGYGDIFKAGTADGERIVELPLAELHPPEFHPFQVKRDEAMERLVWSVKQHGVREPGLARPRAAGGYELLCGNRRKLACEIAGTPTLPVIIREMSDEAAAIAMVDSNLQQREKLLPSEKAWAYRIKMEALNHSGIKGEYYSFEVMVAQTGESKNQIYRLIQLTKLVDALLDKVDARGLAFNPAVELSYLSYDEQHLVAEAMERHGVRPSLSQTVRLKKLKQAGTLTNEVIDAVLAEDKKPPQGEPTGGARFRKFFPPEYSPKQIEAVIIKLLRAWKGGAPA
ncbi:MAG: ParB/RepB/Spo0J family partition protein [Clostridiales Family XIII bacterium]|jgi:ParB family chromosome partitioning protein|nr:ParB/RepB/Spo0J family partition protein [Clostridiales Family XIII bacterium]